MSNWTFPFAVVTLATCPVHVRLQNEFISFTSAHFHLVVEESNKTPPEPSPLPSDSPAPFWLCNLFWPCSSIS